jgi:hypothetical protein
VPVRIVEPSVPGEVPGHYVMFPAAHYHQYMRSLTDHESNANRYADAGADGEPMTRDELDDAALHYMRGIVSAHRGASGCALALRKELTRRRAEYVRDSGQLVAPFYLEIKLQVISDLQTTTWPDEDWQAQLDEATQAIGLSPAELGEVVDCLPKAPRAPQPG